MTSFRDGVDRQMNQGKKGSELSSDIEKSDSRSRSAGHTVGDRPRLYSDLATWFHLLTAPHDYREEAEFYSALIVEAAIGPVQTVLELGSGGGNNASHMKERFTMTLTDFSPEMLEVSRRINSELTHIQGDMRTLRLDSAQFDAVFVHDAVTYLTSEDDVHAMASTAAFHCRPGGSVVVVPDHVLESFTPPYIESGGHDGLDGHAMRYLMWTTDPDPTDSTYVSDFAYLLRETDGAVRVEHDRHVHGIFSKSVWIDALTKAGFQTTVQTDPWGPAPVFCGMNRVG